jgi:threonine/homoserine/homoserine lactone efflux protein
VENPTVFALTVLAILATPGPTNSLLATAGAANGWRRSLPLVPAEAAGYLTTILTVGLLLSPAVASSPVLAGVLRASVGTYLVLLAVRLWRRGGTVLTADLVVTPTQVFLTTLLNPKALVFALGVVPFGAPPVWPYLLGFVLLLVSVATGWIALGALLGRTAAERGRDHVVPRVGAAAVGTFGTLLVVMPLLR